MDLLKRPIKLQCNTIKNSDSFPFAKGPSFFATALLGSKILVTGRLWYRAKPLDDHDVASTVCFIDYMALRWEWTDCSGPLYLETTSLLVRDKLFCLGGEDRNNLGLWSLDTVLLEWYPVVTKGSPLNARAAVYVEQLDVVVACRRSSREDTRNIVAVLNFDEATWEYPRIKGSNPKVKGAISSAVVGSEVYYCGESGIGIPRRSIAILHCHAQNRFTWSSLIVAAECAGFGTTLCYNRGHLIVFGARNFVAEADPSEPFVRIVDTRQMKWVDCSVEGGPGRMLHKAVMTSKGMFILGGMGSASINEVCVVTSMD